MCKSPLEKIETERNTKTEKTEEGEDEKYQVTESQTSLERKLSSSKVHVKSKQLFQDLSVDFSEDSKVKSEMKTTVQQMLEKYQEKYR
jgi:hypothetical protein